MITLNEIIQTKHNNFIRLNEGELIKNAYLILEEKQKDCFLIKKKSKYYCGSKNDLLGLPLSRTLRDIEIQPPEDISANTNIFVVIEKLLKDNKKYIIIRNNQGKIISVLSSLIITKLLFSHLLRSWKLTSLAKAIQWEYTILSKKNSTLNLSITTIIGNTDKVLGYTKQALKENPNLWFNNIHPDDRKKFIAITKNVIKNKKPSLKIYRFFNRKQKDYIYIYEYVEPLIDNSGKVIGLAGISLDITEKEKLCKKFESYQSLILHILNNINLLIVLINEKGKILYVNRHFLKITGFTKSEVIGKNWCKTFIPTKYKEKVKSIFNNLLNNEKIITSSNVYPIKIKNNETRIIQWENTSIINKELSTKGIAAFGKDITAETKQKEEEYFINRITTKISRLKPKEALKTFYEFFKENFNIQHLYIFYQQKDNKDFKYISLKELTKDSVFKAKRYPLRINQEILNKVLQASNTSSLNESIAKQYNIYLQKIIDRSDFKAIVCTKPSLKKYESILYKLFPILASSFESFIYETKLRKLNQELFKKVEDRTFEIQVLYEISQKISHTLNYNELFKTILTHIHKVIKFDIASFIIFTDDNKEIFIKLTRPTSKKFIQALIDKLINNLSHLSDIESISRKEFLIYTIKARKFKQNVKELKEIKSYFYVPIIKEKKIIGLLYVGAIKKDAFKKENLKIIYTIAAQASVSIQKLHFLLTAQQQQLKDIVENLPNALILLDNQRKIIMMNKEARRILPFLTDSIEGGVLKQLGNIKIRKDFKSLKKLKEIIINKPTYKHFYIQVRPIISKIESMNRWLIVIRDVTEIKEQEKMLNQQKRLAAIGQLAGGVAHDFNNVLTVIFTTTEILLSELSEKNKIYNEILEIKKAAQRASELTRQLLAFSRKQILKPEIINVNDIINNLSKMLYRIIPENIIIEMKLSPELKLIKMDPVQLEQVIVNLIVNAKDAMPQGGNLTIRTENVKSIKKGGFLEPALHPKNYICISVTDTGIGMSDEIKQKIFEPFFTTKEHGKGTGLGLSTVYGIVRQSNGYIAVESEPGKGSTFYIYLPAVSEKEIKNEKISREKIELTKGSGTILLVEDEIFVQNATKRILEKFGYNVIVANDGISALELFQKQKDEINIVITDITMPKMSGIELIKEMKKIKPEIKYFYTSGYSDDNFSLNDEEKKRLLQKPFFIEELLKKIKS